MPTLVYERLQMYLDDLLQRRTSRDHGLAASTVVAPAHRRGRHRDSHPWEELKRRILHQAQGGYSDRSQAHAAALALKRQAERGAKRPLTTPVCEEVATLAQRFFRRDDSLILGPRETEAEWTLFAEPDRDVPIRVIAATLPDGSELELGISLDRDAMVEAGYPPEVFDERVGNWITGRIFPVKIANRDRESGKIYWTHQRNHVVLDVPEGARFGNYGGVGLLYDPHGRDGRPAVCLVAQHRFVINDWLIEACRGFASQQDGVSSRTIAREIAEEAFLYVASDRPKFLGSLYTDSGKLRDRPDYYLVRVDKSRRTDRVVKKQEALEAPAWFTLSDFYKAVLTQQVVAVNYDPFDDPLIPEFRPHLVDPIHRDIGPNLIIRDTFTTTIALLALPFFRAHYGEHLALDSLFALALARDPDEMRPIGLS